MKRAGDSFNELDVGYFVSESELDQYTEDERVRYESGDRKGKLRMYEKGTFIYRLAGREREKSASYYTPEVLTKCLVKYALKELLEGKTADEILELTICEPAMGSAAFLNEAINQLAEAYISRKEQELAQIISYEYRFNELQKVKMYIADRNVYGIDLNPVAVELAEVSLWLNTIYEGGFVPWFGTQLVNGNSLIGARRQVYRIDNAQATSKGLRWYENEPERLPFGTARADKGYKFGRKQIYHFLLGDPGMCSYSDKVIKSLEPENIKKMVNWNKKFTAPITDDDVITLLRLSETIDNLWDAQIKLRKEVGAKTKDALSIFGHVDDAVDSHTTIRQKDKIYSELYKSEHMKNAGPYARLKFAMDYWCALWFWPIDQAELLPTRSEFLFDMSLILEGTMASVNVTDSAKDGQLSLFPTEMEQMAMDIIDTYGTDTIVDIPRLRKENLRLDLAARIAEQNKFMHWELEFADLFAERGGFDLIIGNPPWIKEKWDEQSVLADCNPLFTIRDFPVHKKNSIRSDILVNREVYGLYIREYTQSAGTLSYLGSVENYTELQGVQTNHYKCFLPQAWKMCTSKGVFAFVHPDGVFDDSKGDCLRRELYPRLKRHFHFINEKLLFQEIGHPEVFSLNVYSNSNSETFDVISNLFDPKTIDECYSLETVMEKIPGIKDNEGEWNTKGHPDRVIKIGKNELKLFAKIFDDSDEYKGARLPVVHAKQLLRVLSTFSKHQNIQSLGDKYYATQMFDETGAQDAKLISPDVHFTDDSEDMVYSGPHIGVANPYNQTPRANCSSKGDNDKLDLVFLPDQYLARTKYRIVCQVHEYHSVVPTTPWNTKYNMEYKLLSRKMLNLKQERTLMSAIAPPKTAHINGIYGLCFSEMTNLVLLAGCFASLPYDFFIKCLGKTNFLDNTAGKMPIPVSRYDDAIKVRALMLNCLSSRYKGLWKNSWSSSYTMDKWSITDSRLSNDKFSMLSNEWSHETPLRTDFERRFALIELDVLVAKALGLSLNELKTIYNIQFPVLQQYEQETWFDANGRIVFTNNRGLSGVGVDRKTWETVVSNLKPGETYTQAVIDGTIAGSPIERTLEYVAPFDCRDREKDYETAWKFFEKKCEER